MDEDDQKVAGTCREGECVPNDHVVCECEGESSCCDGCSPINVGGECDEGELPCVESACSDKGECLLTALEGWCLTGEGTKDDPWQCGDLSTDPANCGTCGHICPEGAVCIEGDCFTPVTGVTMEPATLSLPVGAQHTFIPVITPDQATDQRVTWASDHETVATVDGDGTVTALEQGVANITVTTDDGNFTASVALTVVVPVDGVVLSPEQLQIPLNSSSQLTVEFLPPNASNQEVTWSSGDPHIISIDQNGLLFVSAVGQTTITVTTEDGDYMDSITVIVRIPLTSLTISPQALFIPKGDTEFLTVIVDPENATIGGLSWVSTDPHMATVDSDGAVIALEEGTATIRVTVTTVDGDFTADCAVTVDMYMWARAITSFKEMDLFSLALDEEGNAYMVGAFEESLSFGEGLSFQSVGRKDGFLAKYDPHGQVEWARTMGGKNKDEYWGVGVDWAGNVTVAGDTYSFDTTVDGVPLPYKGNSDIVIAQYDRTGELIWVKRIGTNYSEYAVDMVVDRDGSIYLLGMYESGNLNFGGENLPYYYWYAGYLLKLDSEGNYLWDKAFYSHNGDLEMFVIQLDSEGNVVVGGVFEKDMVIEGVTHTNSLSHNGDNWSAPFLVKYDSDGDLLWSKAYGGQWLYITALALDASDSIYVTGTYGDQIDWGGGVLSADHNLYLAKLNDGGEHIWSKEMGIDRRTGSIGLALNSDGQMYMSGYFYGDFNLGGDTFSSENYRLQGFLGKFTNSGEHLWSTAYEPESPVDMEGVNVKVDHRDRVVFTGVFQDRVTFSHTTLDALDEHGAFIVKLKL